MLEHFRGNLDNWDPALPDAFARERDVILVDYPGVGSSSGEFGPTIAATARSMIAFVAALDLTDVDLLGFSIGGFVAQEIALIRPALVRRLVLAATGPKGAPGMHGWRKDIAEAARLEPETAEPPDEHESRHLCGHRRHVGPAGRTATSGGARRGEVRVRVAVSGANPTDWKSRSGAFGRSPAAPTVPDHDGAGIVDAVGPGVGASRPATASG